MPTLSTTAGIFTYRGAARRFGIRLRNQGRLRLWQRQDFKTKTTIDTKTKHPRIVIYPGGLTTRLAQPNAQKRLTVLSERLRLLSHHDRS